MKIKNLVLENITTFKRAEIEFNQLTIISGKNNTGKTTIVEAIKKLLTGKSTMELLKDGEKTGAISAEIDSYKLKRGLAAHSQSLEIDGFSGPMGEVQSSFLNRYNLDPEKVTAILDPISFLEKDAAKKQSILASLLNLNFDIDWLVQTVEDKEVSSWIGDYKKVWGDTRGLELVDTIYKFAYQWRRDANRDVKTLHTVAPKIEFSETLEELRKQKATLEKEQTDYFTSLTAAERVKGIKHEIEEEERKVADLQESVPTIKGDGEKVQFDLKTAKANVNELIDRLAALSRIGTESVSRCPVFSIPCPLPAEKIDQIKGEKETKIQEIKQQLDAQSKEIERLQNRIAKFEEKESILKSIQEHEAKIAELVKKLKSEPPAPKVRPLPEIQKEIETVNKKIAQLQVVEEVRGNLKALKKAEEQSQFCDGVLKVFDPKTGLKASLLQKRIGKLQSGISQALQAMSDGYEVELSFEPETQVMVKSNGKTVTAESLSESERMRLGVAFQYAFSLISKAKIFVIDRADILDLDNRRKLSDLLVSSREYFDTIILSYTHNTPAKIEAPKESWISTYYLGDNDCHKVTAG